ncbi:MAG TPA: YdeI/OmpD-associated family protein [Chitinophagales bacterium]|nr:YdeI/OmpD-associated family protein [Chitinophagales bacterium]
MKSFSAKIFKIGVNPYVLLPASVLNELFSQSGKNKGPIPVRGTLNGKEFIQTLVKYSGKWRLYLNTPMRKAAGIDVGDIAKVRIEFDSMPRNIPMHPKLQEALTQNKKAKEAFEKLTPSRRKEIIRYLVSMKSAESVTRNVEKILHHLSGKVRFAGRD